MALRLVVEGIGYTLPGSSAPLLAEVSFDTEGYSRVGLIGRSGIGKTTLFRILAGLEPDHEGTVSFPTGGSKDVCIGYCYQDRRLMPWATLRQNVEYALPPDQPMEVVDHFIARLGLSRSSERKARDASGGEQARCAIARALVSGPELLLLDEPMSGLDEPARRQLIRDLLEVQAESGFLMLLITHDTAEVAALCDFVHVLNGSPARVVKSLPINGPWNSEQCEDLEELISE